MRAVVSCETPVPWLVGATLATVALAPSLLGGVVNLDGVGSVEMAVVGVMEAMTVLVWASGRDALPRPASRVLAVLVAAWVAAMVAATVAAIDVAPAVVRTTSWLVHLAFATVVWAEARHGRTAAAEHGAVAGFVVTAVLVVWAWFGLPDVEASQSWGGAVPLVGNIRLASIYGLVGATFGAQALVRTAPAWRPGLLAAAVCTLGWAALWWGGSRGALAGAVLASALLVRVAQGRRWPVAGVLALCAGLGAALSLALFIDVPYAGLWRFMPGVPRFAPGVAGFTAGRTSLWATAVEAWLGRPWLGRGPGATVSLMAPMGHMHVHNVGLQALVEWGVLGALPFAALAAMVLARAVQIRRDGPAGAAAYLLALATVSVFDGVTSHTGPTVIGLCAAALVLAAPRDRVAVGLVHGWTGGRRTLTAVALLGLAVFAVHLVVLRAVWAPGTPAPGSARARLVLAVPTYAPAKEIEGWGRTWMRTDPAAAERLVRWGLALERNPWLFLRLRGDLARQRGDLDAALADYCAAAEGRARLAAGFDRYLGQSAPTACVSERDAPGLQTPSARRYLAPPPAAPAAPSATPNG
ncbi:MAG TPA: O-antigen ligase family protein [Rubricoccaceae bacterium]